MGDRPVALTGGRGDIINARPKLMLKHQRILLNEKKAQHDAITVRIEMLKSVEIQQLELQQDILKEEMSQLRERIVEVADEIGGDEKKIVDAEFKVINDDD